MVLIGFLLLISLFWGGIAGAIGEKKGAKWWGIALGICFWFFGVLIMLIIPYPAKQEDGLDAGMVTKPTQSKLCKFCYSSIHQLATVCPVCKNNQ